MTTKETGPTTGRAWTPEEVKNLLELVSKLGLEEVSVEDGAFRLHVVGYRTPAPAASAEPASAPAAPATRPASNNAPSRTAEPANDDDKYTKVTAPMIGTFYRSPAPDAPSFVEVGDRVDENTVLCIVEAMKLMNEIKAETRGVIKKILVENGKPVEYGQPMFLVDPS